MQSYSGLTSYYLLKSLRDLKKWINEKRNLASLEQQTQPQDQLQRMLQSEEARLNKEHARVEQEKRKSEAQKRFLNQMDLYHPLRAKDNLKTTKGKYCCVENFFIKIF